MNHRRYLMNALMVLCVAISAFATNDIDGSWKGELDLGMMKLPLVLKFRTTGSGTLECVLISPQQSEQEIPADASFIAADSIQVSVPPIAMKYVGKVSDNSIEGTFSQMGQSFPLTMTRGEVELNRPQNPKKPYPYNTEELTFTNPNDNVELAGTLTYPVGYEGMTEVPVVVLVSGSGQQDRDESLMGHSPFLVIADYLARNGIASFRYDDRGVGGSKGDPAVTTVQSNTADALAAVDMIRSLGKFSTVGLWGHSEGGLIAFMLGASPSRLDFIIAEAGPALKGRDIISQQMVDMLTAMGESEDNIQEALKMQDATLKTSSNPWMTSFLELDPIVYIEKIEVPVFAFYGTKDVQVKADINSQRLKEHFPDPALLQLKVYEGLNHLMQPAVTGLLNEYGQIETTISEEVLRDATLFILNR